MKSRLVVVALVSVLGLSACGRPSVDPSLPSSGAAPAMNQAPGHKSLTQLRQEASFPVFVPGLVPSGWRAGTPWRSSESSPIIHVSYADTEGKPGMLVSSGPAGSGLDAVPGKSGKSVLVREMITAHYLQNQPEFGGPILWWDEAWSLCGHLRALPDGADPPRDC